MRKYKQVLDIGMQEIDDVWFVDEFNLVITIIQADITKNSEYISYLLHTHELSPFELFSIRNSVRTTVIGKYLQNIIAEYGMLDKIFAFWRPVGNRVILYFY